MHIALFTHKFSPDIGGIETMSQILAAEFTRMGQAVTVVTHSADGADDAVFPFRIVRRPTPIQLAAVIRASDVVFHNNICLRFMWPLVLFRRPLVVAVHTWIQRNDGSVSSRDRLKQLLLRNASVIAVSNAIADHLDTASVVIPNSYQDDLFYADSSIPPDPASLVFVGRLVRAKGAHLAIQALQILADRGLHPSLTIIGEGPERDDLQRQARELGLEGRVALIGALRGVALRQELNRHAIALVPSVWNEPFGIVALETVAAGCVTVASRGGGLPDAIGPCGLLFENGDVLGLANAVERLLTEEGLAARLLAGRERHLANHTAEKMASRYLEVIAAARN